MWFWLVVHIFDICLAVFCISTTTCVIVFRKEIINLLNKIIKRVKSLFKYEVCAYLCKEKYGDRFYLSGDNNFVNNLKFAIFETYESIDEFLEYASKHYEVLKQEYGEDIYIRYKKNRRIFNMIKNIIPRKKDKELTIIYYENNENK